MSGFDTMFDALPEPTPKQERLTLTTAYGEAVVRDQRSPDSEEWVASITFDEVEVNRKVYKDVSLSLEWNKYRPEGRWEVSTKGNYRDLTDSAQEKLTAAFAGSGHGGLMPELEPYMHPLDPEEMHQKKVSRAANRVLFLLNRDSLSDYSREEPEILDEVLRMILDKRAEGLTYSRIYTSLP